MPLEKTTTESPSQESLPHKEQQWIERSVKYGKELFYYAENQTSKCWYLIPLQHYREAVTEAITKVLTGRNLQTGKEAPPENRNLIQPAVDYVIQLSDPDKITAYDALVDEFNAVVDECKAKASYQGVNKFAERLRKLFK